MLDQTERQAILTLHERGLGKRAIARALGISRNTVREVLIDGHATPPPLERAEQLERVRDEILALHASCKGNFVRVHEELAARHGLTVSYPALTAFCRKHGVGHAPPMPKGSYDDVLTPGLEMQHDTSPCPDRRRRAAHRDGLAGAVLLTDALLPSVPSLHALLLQGLPDRRARVRDRGRRDLHD